MAGAVRCENQAQSHPLRLLRALAEELTIWEGTRVLEAEGDQLRTTGGTVRAKHIIFCCHFPFVNAPGHYFLRMHQERSYVVALEGTPAVPGMYYSADSGGASLRMAEGLLLVGGGSHRTGENREGGKYEALRRWAGLHFPGASEAGHWSAQDCMTLDGLPFIGRFSRRRPCWYVATGFGKWGMTTAMVSARILTALIRGRESPEGDIFSPRRRFTAQAAKGLAVHGAYTVKGLAKHLLPSGDREIVPNCPHMGCRLEWNPEEESYDCPCHGSRFRREGRLIDGPAQTDCRRKEEGRG